MRAVLLLALWPTLAGAEEATRFSWGVPVEGTGPSLLALEPCDLPCVVVVRFDNTLITSGYMTGGKAPVRIRTTLAIEGLEVDVTVENGGGSTPDRVRVLPPPGHRVEPLEQVVEENATGHVRVFLTPTS